MPFEDSMKKVAAISWAPSGKKFAVGAADRVPLYLFSLSISLTKMDKKRINFPLNPLTKDKKATSSVDSSSPLIPRRSQWPKVITSFSFTKWDCNGEKRKLFATNSLLVLQSQAWFGPRIIPMIWYLDSLMEKCALECLNPTNQMYSTQLTLTLLP